MIKEEFIKLVSKIEWTEEDEFKAEYNSPELIWERVIKPNFIDRETYSEEDL